MLRWDPTMPGGCLPIWFEPSGWRLVAILAPHLADERVADAGEVAGSSVDLVRPRRLGRHMSASSTTESGGSIDNETIVGVHGRGGQGNARYQPAPDSRPIRPGHRPGTENGRSVDRETALMFSNRLAATSLGRFMRPI
jgi:hypothetical protein